MKTKSSKLCTKCKEAKPLEDFAVYKGKSYCWCKPCTVKSTMESRNKRMPEFKKYMAKYREENRDKINVTRRKYWHENIDKFHPKLRASHLRRTFGLTIEQYDQILIDQDYTCKICDKPNPGVKRLAVDHDHITGKIRGLLCFKCNIAIGHLNDDPILIRKAIAYLEDSNV